MATVTAFYTKPEWKITPQRLLDIEQYAYDGMNKQQIARCLGISDTTLIDKLKNYPNFLAAYEKGLRDGLLEEAIKIRRVKASLYKNAEDHEVIIKDEAITVPGDVKAQMFILKARAGWQDQKVEISGNPDKPILIAPLFKADYSKGLNAFLGEIHDA